MEEIFFLLIGLFRLPFCGTHLELILYPLELLGGVNLVCVNLLDRLLGAVHQLEELCGPVNILNLDTHLLIFTICFILPFIEESLDKGKIFLPERHDCGSASLYLLLS